MGVMNDHELEVSYRAVSHPLWEWLPGMLGVNVASGVLNNAHLQKARCEPGKDMGGFSPSLRDSLTTHLIWESIKKFDVPGYSLIRYYSPSVYKGGFKKFQGSSVLLFTSPREGVVAIHMWVWFANKQLNLMSDTV